MLKTRANKAQVFWNFELIPVARVNKYWIDFWLYLLEIQILTKTKHYYKFSVKYIIWQILAI